MNFREVEVFPSFSASFFYKQNQTSKSIKCNSSEEWAENWIDVSHQWSYPRVPCSTNVAPVATFDWEPYSKRM